jgi:hypothetical protein
MAIFCFHRRSCGRRLYYVVSCGLEGLPEEVGVEEDVTELALKLAVVGVGEGEGDLLLLEIVAVGRVELGVELSRELRR